MNILKQPRQILQKIENYPIKIWQLSAWFLFVIFIRNLLESLTDGGGNILDFTSFFIHYPVFYLAVFLTVILIYYFFSKNDIYKIIKTVLLFSFFIWIAPIVDMIFPLFSNMSYIGIDSWDTLWKSYLTLGLGGVHNQGASTGIKAELVVALLGSLGYLILKRNNIFKSAVGSIIVYASIITWGLLPSIYSFLYYKLGINFIYNDQIIGLTFAVFSVILILIIWKIENKNKFYLWIKNINWFRTSLVWTMMILGMMIYLNQRFDPVDFYNNYIPYIIKVISILIIGFIIWQAGRLMNDLADYEFDQVNHNKNLLNYFNRCELINILIIYLALFSCLTLLISYEIFVILSAYLIIGYFYCFKPIHLKRHFISSSIVLSFDYMLAFWAGYVLFFTKGDSLNLLPAKFSLLILVMGIMSINIKDIKDGKSDKLQGIATLVTIFGKERSSVIIGVLIFICSIIPGIFFNWFLVFPGLAGYAAIFYITDKFKTLSRQKLILLTLIVYLVVSAFILNTTTKEYIIGNINLTKESGWHPQSQNEVWIISGLLEDENKNQYYFSQTYSPKSGSFLSLTSLSSDKNYKEYFPNNETLAITKNSLNINHYLPLYRTSNELYENKNFSYNMKTSFEDGFLKLNLKNKYSNIITLSDTGEINFPNNQTGKYYIISNLEADGKILFQGNKIINIKGEVSIEHLWGDFDLTYNRWMGLNLNMRDRSKIITLIFDYGENGSLVFGAIYKEGRLERFNQVKIDPISQWENTETENFWIEKMRFANKELNIDLILEASMPQQEMEGHNIWEGIMQVKGKISENETDGWGSFREIRL